MTKEEMSKLLCPMAHDFCLTDKCVHYRKKKTDRYIGVHGYRVETIYVSHCKLWWNKGE